MNTDDINNGDSLRATRAGRNCRCIATRRGRRGRVIALDEPMVSMVGVKHDLDECGAFPDINQKCCRGPPPGKRLNNERWNPVFGQGGPRQLSPIVR